MIESIKFFENECIGKFEQLENNFMKDPTKIAEYVLGLTQELHKLGLEMIKESLESMDQMIQKSPIRKNKWNVESHTDKQLTTSLGNVRFQKTLFINKETGHSEYLLDRILGISPNTRITEDAEARLLEEAVQTSYRRGGEEVSLTTEVSRQTVKNKIHKLDFPRNEKPCPPKKRIVDFLYIDADEDHLSLQYQKQKGDLVTGRNKHKNNCIYSKLVYVYEGVEGVSPKGERRRLINPHYFCSTGTGKENEAFWDKIYAYIDIHYDLSHVKKIYVNSDGGGWIKAGIKRIEGTVHVLDEFHLSKYLMKLSGHMLDEKKEVSEELKKIILFGTKKEFLDYIDILTLYAEKESTKKRMQEAQTYILSNWMAAKIRLLRKNGVLGSSTEGHVSHVLSDRMSSRPMGWSRLGAAKMSNLRAYYLNGGSMLELIRYQKTVFPMASGCEYDVLSATDIMLSEKNRHGELGKYLSCISHSMSIHNRKVVFFQSHLWGL